MKFQRKKNDQPNDVTFSDIYFNKYDKYESFALTGWIHATFDICTDKHTPIRNTQPYEINIFINVYERIWYIMIREQVKRITSREPL